MNHTTDKMSEPKIAEVKHVRGYVAPTETGRIRIVKSHEKLVEVDAKTESNIAKKEPTKTKELNIKSKDGLDRIRSLNGEIRAADFSKGTEKLSNSVLNLYRTNLNTSFDTILDSPDGIRNLYDGMNQRLLDIGFSNRYNLSAKQALIRITTPEYMRTLASKTNLVQQKLRSLGLSVNRVDPFTLSIDHPNTEKKVYVSNNPLDHITSDKLNKVVSVNDSHIVASVSQNDMNDFVFFMTNKKDGRMKTASAVTMYDQANNEFVNFGDALSKGALKKDIKSLDAFMRENVNPRKYSGDGYEWSLADSQVYEIKAMIMNRLATMQQKIEEEVKGGKDIMDLLQMGDTMFGGHALQKQAILVKQGMQATNRSFEMLASGTDAKSFAPNSPLQQKMSSFGEHLTNVESVINKVLDTALPE
jgi:hypothetical protein